jgi:hypothetical protein
MNIELLGDEAYRSTYHRRRHERDPGVAHLSGDLRYFGGGVGCRRPHALSISMQSMNRRLAPYIRAVASCMLRKHSG